MTYFWLYLGLALVIYTTLSVWFFLANMGDKYRKSRWYDWPLLGPAYLICLLIGWYSDLAYKWTKR